MLLVEPPHFAWINARPPPSPPPFRGGGALAHPPPPCRGREALANSPPPCRGREALANSPPPCRGREECAHRRPPRLRGGHSRRYSFIAAIALDLGIARAGPADGDQAADSAADDRHHRPPDLRHDAGLQLTQLGSAEEEDLVDA